MILYKFISLANAELLLSNVTVKFTHPSNFNDPFDCCEDLMEYNIGQGASKEVIKDLEILAQQLNLPLQTLNALVEKDPNLIPNAYRFSNKGKFEKTSVLCLSETYRNIVMWAHYADCHQGVCFGFDVSIKPFLSEGKDNLLGLNKVSYSEFSPKNYLANKEEALINMFSTKAPDWQYEKEYRFVLSEEEGLYKFNKSTLKEVIFGCKCSDENIMEVISLCNKLGYEKLSYLKAKRVKLELKFDAIAG